MEKIQRQRLLWRIPLVAAILVAMFWGIWSFFGSIPSADHIQMTEKWAVQLPFSVSRWWDVLFAPIWAFLLVLILSSERIKKEGDLAAGLGFGLVVGLAVGPVFGPAFGLVFGPVIGLGFSLVVGLGFGLGAGLKFLFSRGPCVRLDRWLAGK